MRLTAIGSLLSLSLLAPGACAPPNPSSQGSDVTESNDCRVPRVMFVVDASGSMLESLDTVQGSPTKWQALGTAVHEVLADHGNGAQFGLMAFPGTDAGCSPGSVLVDLGVRTSEPIDAEISQRVIPPNAATPAGQTLMAASTYERLLDPSYDNYVIFISDGWQYCSLQGDGAPQCANSDDCETMGLESCSSCNSCQMGASSPGCSGANADGCYCVRNWPVLGVEALKSAGIKTYVVGFGDKVDVKTLNQAAKAGGDPLPGCDPMSESASCYLKATSTTELSDALGKIMARLTTEPCEGACGIEGTKSCTLEGWTQCKAPKTVECQGSCGAKGTRQCSGGQLGECSAICDRQSTSATGAGGGDEGGASSEGGRSQGEGGSAGAGIGGSEPDPDGEGSDPWDDGSDSSDYEDPPPSATPAAAPEATSGCSYGSGRASGWSAALLLALAWLSRRRRRGDR